MEKLMNQLLESAKKNKRGFLELKAVAVRCQEYELASELRQFELDNFPKSKAQKNAESSAKKTDVLLRMIGLQLDAPKNAWLLEEAFKLYFDKGEELDIKDIARLQIKRDKLFDQ